MFEIINPKVTLVATNYNFTSAIEFQQKLEERDIVSKYALEEQEAKFAGAIPPAAILKDMKPFFPLMYCNKDTKIIVTYIQQEFKLNIEKGNISEENYPEYNSLCSEVLDLKLSDINAIGINFAGNFNLGKNKLQLLNNEILGEIPDFPLNLTFEFALPIKYEDRGLIATYRIKKISGGDNTDKDRIYRISVNNHFDVSKLSTSEKSKKLEEILSVELYKEYLKKCQGFLRLNDGRKKNSEN